ncbi:MAG TPA: glycosyltransferase family 2 protein [Candidatus Eisenbacteria bacterium]|nr:glycosyltransferase family 2 protein [Candidatus Eisenbacteria bacterium]
MNKRPFFSIPIATYNRAEDVEFAVKRILAQSFKDFEVIVCDDGSTDETQKRIMSLKDKRIRYYRNKKNLGAVKNIGKVLEYVRGEYVFLHGDDDYLLYDDVLQKTYDLIKKYNYGLIRINYVYQTFDKKDIFDYVRNKFITKDLAFKAHASPEEAVDYIDKIDLHFITGIVFKNIYPKRISIIDSEFIPWFEICFRSLEAQGGFFLYSHSIVASWSHQDKHPAHFVVNGKLSWEKVYEVIRKVAGEKCYRKTLNRQVAINVNFLAIIKYNSNNSNLLKYAKRLRELNPSYTWSMRYWATLIAAYCTPKFVLKLVRDIYIQNVKGRGRVKEYSKTLKQVYTVRGF